MEAVILLIENWIDSVIITLKIFERRRSEVHSEIYFGGGNRASCPDILPLWTLPYEVHLLQLMSTLALCPSQQVHSCYYILWRFWQIYDHGSRHWDSYPLAIDVPVFHLSFPLPLPLSPAATDISLSSQLCLFRMSDIDHTACSPGGCSLVISFLPYAIFAGMVVHFL